MEVEVEVEVKVVVIRAHIPGRIRHIQRLRWPWSTLESSSTHAPVVRFQLYPAMVTTPKW